MPRTYGQAYSKRKTTPGLHPIIAELTAARLAQNLIQIDLAAIIGQDSARNVLRWENGQNDPSFSRLVAWAKALGFDVVLAPVEVRHEP